MNTAALTCPRGRWQQSCLPQHLWTSISLKLRKSYLRPEWLLEDVAIAVGILLPRHVTVETRKILVRAQGIKYHAIS